MVGVVSTPPDRLPPENRLLELLCVRIRKQESLHFSALLEERQHTAGPSWLRSAQVLRTVDNYLRSGLRFLYLHTSLDQNQQPPPANPPTH